MSDRGVHPAGGDVAEALLRADLARGDAVARSVPPILRHLVADDGGMLFSDAVLSRLRGMISALAADLIAAVEGGVDEVAEGDRDPLAAALADNPPLLAHLHAQALEWQQAEQLQALLGVDPVLSPLLQDMVASTDAEAQALAMTFLAAQARWAQGQRRMTLALRELPGEQLHGALLVLRADAPELGERGARAEAAIRRSYDEGQTRLGLAARLVLALPEGPRTALSLECAGVSLFLTALAITSGQERDKVALAMHEPQRARLVLALRAAGLEPAAVLEQLCVLHPDIELPSGYAALASDAAAALLRGARLGGAPGGR